MIELVVASTVLAVVIVSALASSSSFSAALDDQLAVQRQFMNANLTRMRFLGDADSSTAVSCPRPDQLAFAVAGPPGAYIGYLVLDGALHRYDSVTDHRSVVAERAESLACTDLDTDGVYVSTELGTAELPYHLHLRVSASGGGA